jgi:ribonuclease HI
MPRTPRQCLGTRRKLTASLTPSAFSNLYGIGDHLKYVVQLAFSREDAINNTAEYEGLLAGLRIAIGMDIFHLVVRGDSQLVVNKVNKAYDCPQMWAYMDEVRKLERCFDGLKLEHI